MKYYIYEMNAEEMAAELYKKYDVDYSYTTLKEAEPMIREDYEAFAQFEKVMKNVVDVLEDAAGAVFQNGAIIDYFKKKYNYEEWDNKVAYLLDYIGDYYNYCI